MTSDTPKASKVLDRVLVLEMVRVTEAAAIAASTLVGRGDEKAADAAAVEAMRAALNTLDMDGTVVIGEGERDEAPMLFIGEKVGTRQGPRDRHRARSAGGHDDHREGGAEQPGGAGDRRGGRAAQRARRLYGQDRGRPGLSRRHHRSRQVADRERHARSPRRRASSRSEIIVCVLDRPRHEALIAELRAIGCGVMLIGDGDVAGVIATTDPDTDDRRVHGIGRRARGRAGVRGAALRRRPVQGPAAVPQRRRARARARKWGVTDLDKQYDLTELAKGDCIFAATGVTDGSLLAGVKRSAAAR